MQSSHRILRKVSNNGNNSRLTLDVRQDFPDEYSDNGNSEATAEEILAEAREQSEKILSDARQQAEKEAERITAEAYKEGYEKGYQEAISQAEKEAEEIRKQAREVLQQAEEIRANTFDAAEGEIVSLSLEVAERLVAQQLSLDRDTILSITREAIELVKNREKLNIFINPADENVIKENLSEVYSNLPSRTEVDIIKDESITPGGCIVETEHGKVDATLETRWEQILESLGMKGDVK